MTTTNYRSTVYPISTKDCMNRHTMRWAASSSKAALHISLRRPTFRIKILQQREMYVCGTSNRLIPPSIVFQPPPPPCSAPLFIAFSRGDAISITPILKIDRGHPQHVYTLLFHFSPFRSLFQLVLSRFTPATPIARHLWSPYIDRFFFPARCLSATIPSCVYHNSVTYPTEIDTLRPRISNSFASCSYIVDSLSSDINVVQSADFGGNNPADSLFLSLFLFLFLSVFSSLSLSLCSSRIR